MEIENIILWLLALIILGPAAIALLILPSQHCYAKYKKGNANPLIKAFAIPYVLVHRITHGGYELYALYKIGLFPSSTVRRWYVQAVGGGNTLSRNVVIHIGLQLRSPWKIKVGKGTVIGDHCTLDARSGLAIGDNVNISSNVSIWTLQHDYRDPYFATPDPNKRRLDVKIEDRAWLGCNVIVLPGVTIGEGAVCCGGCVVTKDVEPYSVVAGIPAKKIGERPKNMKYEFNGKSCWMY